jgi:hypothetical protein
MAGQLVRRFWKMLRDRIRGRTFSRSGVPIYPADERWRFPTRLTPEQMVGSILVLICSVAPVASGLAQGSLLEAALGLIVGLISFCVTTLLFLVMPALQDRMIAKARARRSSFSPRFPFAAAQTEEFYWPLLCFLILLVLIGGVMLGAALLREPSSIHIWDDPSYHTGKPAWTSN